MKKNGETVDSSFVPNKRLRILAEIILRSGRSISKLRLMKLSFLYGTEYEATNGFYGFVPYNFGPFSFQLYHELNGTTANNSYIDILDKEIILHCSDSQSSFIDMNTTRNFDVFWEEYSNISTPLLIKYVYDKYPWFTSLSSDVKKRKAHIHKAEQKVYMIGCEGTKIDSFLNFLLKAGIQNIIDVRANPVSRVYGFHKGTLQKISSNVGLKYFHFPELGVPSEWRSNLNELSAIFNRYRNEIIAENEFIISKISNIINENPSVLLCQEADSEKCHRHVLAERISEITSLSPFDLKINYE